MTLDEIRSMQENVWRQARGSATPPDPSTALLGTEEALAIDEASSKLQREADAREKDFKSGKAKREPFKAWRERLAKEEDERDRKAKEEKVGDLERQWSREEIVAIWARFDVKMEDVDYMIKTGGDDVDQAWHDLQIIAKVVLAPPQLGALENYASTASDIGKEWKEKGGLEKTSHIPHIPVSAVPVGSVAKKGTTKRRRTTNLSMGEVHACISRRGMSVNERIDLQANFPELHLTKIKEIRESGEILGASYVHVVSEQRRSGVPREWSSERFLQVTAGLSDLEAYFRQFLQSVRDRLRTMVFMKLPSDSCAAYFKDGRLQFG